MKNTIKEHFEGIMQNVNAEIQMVESCESDTLTICQKMLCYLQDVLAELKQYVLSYKFKDKPEEIEFFKELKPQILCHLIYYNSLYNIELKCPNGSEDAIKQYYDSELNQLTDFFDSNLSFYQYYRTNATYLDEKYFLRGKPDIHLIIDSSFFDSDPQFSTSYDYKVAKVLANELLKIYLTNLKISDKTLQRLRVSGTIAYSNIRGRYFYKIGEIKRMLEERLIKSNSECLNDLVTNHKLYVKERRNLRKNK